MARIRTVKPEIWEDESFGALSIPARLLFIASFNMADDEGLLRWTPSYIKAQAFIYDDSISMEDTERLMSELVAPGMVFPYKGGKLLQPLAFIVNFRKHQKINRPQPSKLPPPSLQSAAVKLMYGRRDGWSCHLCNAPIVQKPSRDERMNLSIDHLLPRSDGGLDYPSNVHIAHLSCNKSRRNKPLSRMNTAPDVTELFSESSNDKSHEPTVNDTRTSNEDDMERSLLEQGTGNRDKDSLTAARRARVDQSFDDFWAAYPRRVGKDAARKAWAKACVSTSTVQIIEGAKNYAGQREGEDSQYTAHPATWLNAGRWDDEAPRTVHAEDFQLPTAPRDIADDPDPAVFVRWAKAQRDAWVAAQAGRSA